MPTPLAELRRIPLVPAYVGVVGVWKANDAAETVIVAVKDPRVDADDTSIYAMARSGALTYLGTTVLGKDGGCSPVVYNDGTVVLFLSEVPVADGPGSSAQLYLVTLAHKIAAAAPGPVGARGPQGVPGPQGPKGDPGSGSGLTARYQQALERLCALIGI